MPRVDLLSTQSHCRQGVEGPSLPSCARQDSQDQWSKPAPGFLVRYLPCVCISDFIDLVFRHFPAYVPASSHLRSPGAVLQILQQHKPTQNKRLLPSSPGPSSRWRNCLRKSCMQLFPARRRFYCHQYDLNRML